MTTSRSVSCATSTWAAAIILGLARPGGAADRYAVIKIGEGVKALAINGRNEVVGYVQHGESVLTREAFLWRAETGLVLIGGYTASGINERSQIAGQAAWLQAGVWEDGAWIVLPKRQSAWAINDRGQVTGLISAQSSIPGPYAPFRDDDIASPDFIELERPWPYASHGFDINKHGEVVADCGGAPGGLYAGVFYRADTSHVVLDSAGSYDAHARAINDVGQIVGNARAAFGSDHRAVFWDSPDSPMQDMGRLGAGNGLARDINNAGQAVGFSAGAAFLWTADDGMVDLNKLISPAHRIELTEARAINDHGVIVTLGLDPAGALGSFVLLPVGAHAGAPAFVNRSRSVNENRPHGSDPGLQTPAP